MDQAEHSAREIRRVGVIGGGQLAWMMLDAAKGLGLELMLQTPLATDPAIHNSLQAGQNKSVNAVLAPIADAEATARLAEQCEVITFENEFVDLEALSLLERKGTEFRPRLSVLASLLDKYEQRQFLQSLNLPVPPFATITAQDSPADLGLEFPVVIKSRRHGYDGQGTFIIKTAAELEQFWQRFETAHDNQFMAEAFVPFERELAIMAARSTKGEIALYPVTETYQQQQVCRWAIAPAQISSDLREQVNTVARTLLEAMNTAGIFGIELFLTTDGRILVNEIAPRTHNSGHLTIDACQTSQFEQHLRAVCGMPLGDPSLKSAGAVMVNLLGFETSYSIYPQRRERLEAIPNAKLYWYSKDAKPGRKLGHVTVLLDSAELEAAVAMAQEIEKIWYSSVR